MRTETIKIHTFNELSDNAKNVAREWFRESGDMCYEECVDSMKAFAEAVGIHLNDWTLNIEPGRSYVRWSWNDEPETEGMTPARLRTWIVNNWLPELKSYKYLGQGKKKEKSIPIYSKIQYSYSDYPFTGYYTDIPFTDTILSFVNAPNSQSLDDLITDAFEEMFCQLRNEYEHQNSDEYTDEMLEINRYEFTKNGEIY